MFVSVIPALKMPIGHDFFDYQLLDGTAHAGDLILVPFRNKLMPALVAKVSPTSEYADKAIALAKPEKILKFPEAVPDYCLAAARECFVSPATMLHAWLRVVPKRLNLDEETHTPFRAGRRPSGSQAAEERYLVNRYAPPDGLIGSAQNEQPNGRVLIVTPWQSRVQYLENKLGCPGFHALTAAGAAWKAWTGFLREPHGMLVTTRVGAWLAICADVVIIDEPENDDHKQDELTPRYDARRLIALAQTFNPSLRSIAIGTTPKLSDLTPPTPLKQEESRCNLTSAPQNPLLARPERSRMGKRGQGELGLAPQIDLDIKIEALIPGSRSQIEAICSPTYQTMLETLEAGRAVRILHAIGGARGRIRCADCGWVMICGSCGYGLNNMATEALCRRCGHKEPLPSSCPQCKGTDLNRSMIGTDLLQQQVTRHFPGADIKVVDLQAWPTQSLPPHSLVVITNINFIGGYTEDIRRKERMVIAFRRLAAQVSLAQSRLMVQGSELLTNECPTWLTPEGLQKAWSKELADRRQFDYPPTHTLIKLIITAQPDETDPVTVKIHTTLGEAGWEIRGPYKVENRAENRDPRMVYHLLPPPDLTRNQIVDFLTPLASLGILDLDPIAFFS